MGDTDIKEGDKVSWNWGPSGTNPSGEAKQVKADEVKITSHRGNEIKKKGDESNPAVEVERSGNNVVKLASELEVERDGPKKTNGASEGQGKDEPKTKKDEGDEKEEDADKDADDKDDKDDKNDKNDKDEDDKAEMNDDKAEKKDDKSKDDKSSAAASKNGTKSEQSKPQEAKKRGRPAGKASGSGAPKGEKPKKRAATESGEPRRSKRNKN